MCSPDEMAKIVPIVRECTCLRSIIIMDRSGTCSFPAALSQFLAQSSAA